MTVSSVQRFIEFFAGIRWSTWPAENWNVST